jgi:hypothetical protein
MTVATRSGALPLSSRDAPTSIDLAGWPRIRAWIADAVGVLALGLMVPVAILVIGTPIALAARLVIAVATWLYEGRPS